MKKIALLVLIFLAGFMAHAYVKTLTSPRIFSKLFEEILRKDIDTEIPDSWNLSHKRWDEYSTEATTLANGITVERLMPDDSSKAVILRGLNSKSKEVLWSFQFPDDTKQAQGFPEDMVKFLVEGDLVCFVAFDTIANGAELYIIDSRTGKFKYRDNALGLSTDHSEYRNEPHLMIKNNLLYVYGDESHIQYINVYEFGTRIEKRAGFAVRAAPTQ